MCPPLQVFHKIFESMKLYKKKYGVFGLLEYHAVLPLGGGSVRIDFRHGSITTRGIEPATFTTDNQIVQQLIEESDKFKSGRIKLVSQSMVGEVSEVAAKPVSVSDAIPYPDVKNSQMAKEVLMGEPYNVPLGELPNKEAVMEKAESLHVVFPNWK